MPLRITPLALLTDNYAYFLEDIQTGVTALVDPCESAPVIQYLENQAKKLDFILLTHHHRDHVNGTAGISKATGAKVIGFAGDAARLPKLDIPLQEGSSFSLGESILHILEIPGHTLGHIAYYEPETPALFCGDTLFSIGCGKLFEGTAEMMWHSLQKLRALPDETQVFCGHEYTEKNIAFALALEHGDAALLQKQQTVRELRLAGKPSVPSALTEEKALNPYLRCDNSVFKESIGMADKSPEEVLAHVRALKDAWHN